MKEMILITIVLFAFCFGFYITTQTDAFFKEAYKSRKNKNNIIKCSYVIPTVR